MSANTIASVNSTKVPAKDPSVGWIYLFCPLDLFSDFPTTLCAQGAWYAWIISMGFFCFLISSEFGKCKEPTVDAGREIGALIP